MFQTATTAKALCKTLWGRMNWDPVVIHQARYTRRIPAPIVLPLVCGHVKGRLSCPEDLTILLVHTHEHETIMENSLRYVGIEDFEILRPELNGPWRSTRRIPALLDYLDAGRCTTKYLLFADSDDAVLRDDPARAIRCLQEASCRMLISSTKSSDFSCMPEAKAFAEQLPAARGHAAKFLNAGVFVGETEFVREVFRAASRYVTDEDLSREEYRRLRAEQKLSERLPDFPSGIGSDQNILRYLFPRLYPDLKIDYAQRLALR